MKKLFVTVVFLFTYMRCDTVTGDIKDGRSVQIGLNWRWRFRFLVLRNVTTVNGLRQKLAKVIMFSENLYDVIEFK